MNTMQTPPTIGITVLLLLMGLSGQTSAQSETRPTLQSDWQVKFNVNNKQRTAMLSLFADAKTNQSGQWIGLDHMSELANVSYKEGKLSFTAKGPNRNGQSTTWTFNGKINQDKLLGTVSSRNRGEHKVEGKRIRKLPTIVGNYRFSYSNDKTTFALAVRANDEGKLSAYWQHGDEQVPVTDLKYKGSVLTFNSKLGSYTGSLTKAMALNGTYTTADGREFSVLSFRQGAPVIGTWNLEVMSEQGSSQQRLKVNRDLSGWYGALRIKEVQLRGDNPRQPNRPSSLTFKTVMKSGERIVEMSFAGKVTEGKLIGALTTAKGKRKVEGKRAPLIVH